MRNARAARGVTLIELLVVVVIIGILASIGYPLYLDQVRKSRRAEAKSALQEAMTREERLYTTTNTYAASMTTLGYANDPFTSSHGWYTVDGAACGGGGLGECVKLTATAQKDQAKDSCGDFTLDSRGSRAADAAGCW